MYEKNKEETMGVHFRGNSKREPSIVYKMAIGDKVFAKRNGVTTRSTVGKEKNGAHENDFYHGRKRKNQKNKKQIEKIKSEDIEIMWYEKWIQNYLQSWRWKRKEKYGRQEVRVELVHQKYDKLRRRERQRPPTDWL